MKRNPEATPASGAQSSSLRIEPGHVPSAFHRQVVRAGSLLCSHSRLHSPLTCRRVFCDGHLWIEREAAVIQWHCDECGDTGGLMGWQGTGYDGSAVREPSLDQLTAQVRVTAAEHEALCDLQMIDLETQRIIYTAELDDDEVLLTGPAVDLDSLDENLKAEMSLLPRQHNDARLAAVHHKIRSGLARLTGYSASS